MHAKVKAAAVAAFVKISAAGKQLAVSAKKYAGVLQTSANLVWDPRESKSMTHADAEKFIADLNAKEPGMGWRLPTVDELFALADRSKYSPAIDTAFFPKCAKNWYWTSSPARRIRRRTTRGSSTSTTATRTGSTAALARSSGRSAPVSKSAIGFVSGT